MFNAYCGDPIDVSTVSEETLAKKLNDSMLMLENRTGRAANGASLISAGGALQRHVTSAGRTFNIATCPCFKRANSVLSGVLKMNKSDGKEDTVVHKEALTTKDRDRLQTYFKDVQTSHDPALLARYMYSTSF